MLAQTIAHYRIQAKIGAGGMGEVHRATDTRLSRDVAIKVLPEAPAHLWRSEAVELREPRLADLAVLQANPSLDAAACSKVRYTIIGGKVIRTECRPSVEILRPFGGIAHH